MAIKGEEKLGKAMKGWRIKERQMTGRGKKGGGRKDVL